MRNNTSFEIILLQRKDLKMLKLNPLIKKTSKHVSLYPSRQKTLASMIFGFDLHTITQHAMR